MKGLRLQRNFRFDRKGLCAERNIKEKAADFRGFSALNKFIISKNPFAVNKKLSCGKKISFLNKTEGHIL